MIPAFLDGYGPFEKLKSWKMAESRYAKKRAWSIRSFGAAVACQLTWVMGDQMASLEKAANSPQEATWLALDEFEKLEAK